MRQNRDKGDLLRPQSDGQGASISIGVLAARCGKQLMLDIYRSNAGFYLGTVTEEGPFTRESEEYWPKREMAVRALKSGMWTQRMNL